MALDGTTTTGQGHLRIRALATLPSKAGLILPPPCEDTTTSSASSLSATAISSVAGSPDARWTSVCPGKAHSSAIAFSSFFILRARPIRGRRRPPALSATWTRSARESRSRTSRAAIEAARAASLEPSIPDTMQALMVLPSLFAGDAAGPDACPPWGRVCIEDGMSYPLAFRADGARFDRTSTSRQGLDWRDAGCRFRRGAALRGSCLHSGRRCAVAPVEPVGRWVSFV
jgi:hypothetical protein